MLHQLRYCAHCEPSLWRQQPDIILRRCTHTESQHLVTVPNTLKSKIWWRHVVRDVTKQVIMFLPSGLLELTLKSAGPHIIRSSQSAPHFVEARFAVDSGSLMCNVDMIAANLCLSRPL